jgi:hypothetical protein
MCIITIEESSMENILLNNRELKSLAKHMPISAIENAISVLKSVLTERSKEQEIIQSIKSLAEQNGYTLEQLGLVSAQATIASQATSSDDQPVKPKLKSINLESQLFYIEDQNLKLLKTHTMKASLQGKGIELITAQQLSNEQLAIANTLIQKATEQAVQSYNKKVVIWNEYAAAHGLETLPMH